MSRGDDSAHPLNDANHDNADVYLPPQMGLTIREHATIEAMKGLLASGHPFVHRLIDLTMIGNLGCPGYTTPLVRRAVLIADATLAELELTKPGTP